MSKLKKCILIIIASLIFLAMVILYVLNINRVYFCDVDSGIVSIYNLKLEYDIIEGYVYKFARNIKAYLVYIQLPTQLIICKLIIRLQMG